MAVMKIVNIRIYVRYRVLYGRKNVVLGRRDCTRWARYTLKTRHDY